jgi:Ras-related protein Rab-21
MSLKYVDGSFDDNQESTINASYLEKSVTLGNGKVVRLAIWDTAGQEKYNAIAPVYYRDAYGAIIVYEITSAESFDKVEQRPLRSRNGLPSSSSTRTSR